ncbi:blue-sensitive opsin-like [Actinia tenebrosa]|uniref:Blue-sensitive opsin-like n=1 Tax=Actinia tenebrosa TaxID=6105 RepID=A0A6P8HLS7_ACTTE|nr:blue-sensitive opsin-like [Actinia tenebrosa]
MLRLTATGYAMMTSFITFLIVFGGFIQSITLFILLRTPDLKSKSLTPYLINVVVANSVMILGSFPSTLASSIANRWIFNDLVCRLVGFFGGIAAIAMIATMTCITIKIYSTLTIQFGNNKLSFAANKDRTHLKIIAGIWIYSVLSMLPPTAGWTRMIIESADTNCAPDWMAESTAELVYILILTCMAYIIPVSIAVVYIWRINNALSAHVKLMAQMLSAQRQIKDFRNITKMAALAIVAFTITWLPYCLYVLICAFGEGEKIFNAETSVIACLGAKSSILYNPCVYAFVNPRFRASFMTLLKIKRPPIPVNAVDVIVDTSTNRRRMCNKSTVLQTRPAVDNQATAIELLVPSFLNPKNNAVKLINTERSVCNKSVNDDAKSG